MAAWGNAEKRDFSSALPQGDYLRNANHSGLSTVGVEAP